MSEDQSQNQPPTPPAVKAEKPSKISKEVFAAVKAAIFELNPKNPGHKKAVADLDIDDCEVVSKKGTTYVVDAGIFGLRKVTV